jgi:hypothetical protein
MQYVMNQFFSFQIATSNNWKDLHQAPNPYNISLLWFAESEYWNKMRAPEENGYINDKDGKGQGEVGIWTRRRPTERDYGAASMRKAKQWRETPAPA